MKPSGRYRWVSGTPTADGNSGSMKMLMTKDDVEIAELEGVRWVNANAGSNGFYRVNYSLRFDDVAA